jgi:hypothetical protein
VDASAFEDTIMNHLLKYLELSSTCRSGNSLRISDVPT